MEILRQRTDLRHFLGRADQVVFAFTIQTAQSSYDVAGVSTHPELGHPPDINGNSHGEI